jgi:putative membrane protein insertion efficiency factor
MKTIAIFFIRIYQWTIAPIIGNTCRFTPSCSHYGAEAFQKHGFFRGCWLTTKRILRCNPWHNGGGHDPVP